MGLLDSLGYGNQGGYGGLLDFLTNGSPLLKQQEVAQPQYDAMGNSFGAASIPMNAPDPFGPPPQLAQWAAQFVPKSAQPFNVGAAPTAFTGPPQAAPQAPAPMPVQANSPPQVNDMNVGGYSMPRMGSVADFTPTASTDVSAQSRQPQMAQQPQALPPALGGSAPQSPFLRGLQSVARGGGIISAMSGNYNDPQSVAQQNLTAQYKALEPIVGPQKAMLAVMNPEAGKVILAQALEKQQPTFGVIGEGGGGEKAYGFIDPTKKSITPYTAPGAADDRGVVGPDGKLIPYPEGVDKKTFRNEITKISADAAAGKKTGEQATAEIFANKMELSNKALDSLAGQGTSLAGKIAGKLPMGNYIQSPEYQKYKQASSNFITALLRKESGAAIGKEEFDRYDKEYMPQPGDGPEVLAQKTEARRVAIESMKKGAGPGYKAPTAAPLPSGWSVSVR